MGTPMDPDAPPTTTKERRLTPVRILRWVGYAFVAVLVGLYLVLPAAMAAFAVFPGGSDVGPPPDGTEAVTLETADGVDLAAWYAAPAEGAAIILVHGAGESRESLRPYVSLLTEHGYGALALDMRGHGSSEGRINRFGWEGTKDLAAAVAFLQSRNEVSTIGALGLSMGGEALLGASSDLPAITAVVAEGATQRSVDDLTALPSERPLYRNFTARVMYAVVGLLSRADQPRTLLDSMLASGSTRFLLIAGGAEPREIDFNGLFAGELGDRAELWVAEGAGHTGALSSHPDQYEARVLAFFERELTPG